MLIRVPPAGLAAALAATPLCLDDHGRPRVTLMVVDLDAPATGIDPAGLAATADRAPTVLTIGVAAALSPDTARLAAALDCTLVTTGPLVPRVAVTVADPDAEAAELADRVGSRPRAAVALARLLRATAVLPVAAGLAAESAVYSMLLDGPEFAGWRASRPARAPDERPDPVRLARTGDRLTVTIDRPHRRNAFSRAVRDGLAEAFDLAAADPSLVEIHLYGAGPAFCSGGDLDEFGTSTDSGTAHLIRLERSVAARIDRVRDRVTAHLHGACVGAGVELPSFAGRVLAAPDTFVQLPELDLGLVPGAGGSVGVTRRVGRWRTAYLALSGRRLPAATALEWGLVDALDPA